MLASRTRGVAGSGRVDWSRPLRRTLEPGGRDYVLCVFTTKNEDQSWRPVDNAAEVLIGELSRMAWEALEPAGK